MEMEPPGLPDRDGKVVYVKTEPPDLEDTPNEDQSFFQSKENNSIFENVLVKVEFMSCHSDEEMDETVEKILPDDPNDADLDQLQKSPMQDEFMKVEIKQEFDSDDDNSDEDYKPTSKQTKKKKTVNTKPAPKGTPRMTKVIYQDETLQHIDIITISEEERQIEHKAAWHNRKHMKYTCKDCAIGFVVKDAYDIHMKVHSKETGEFECDICHTFMKSQDVLYKHRLRHYRRYRCDVCHALYKEKEAAACHVMTEHEGQAFLCPYCGKGFKRPAYLKKHVEHKHTKPHHIECPICSRVFHERSIYRSHLRTHSEEVKVQTVQPIVICDICSREFKHKAKLARHLMVHENDSSPHTCNLCGYVSGTRHLMRIHYRKMHDKKRVRCIATEATCPHPECLRVCASRALLNHHIKRMHTDRTKKYQCDHCQRYYFTKGEVRSHIMWSHMRQWHRGHTCPCGRMFRTPALLRDHAARAHLKLEPTRDQVCGECGKAFTSKQLLNRHIKSHTDETYPCTECGLAFKTQSYVKIHYKLKHLNMTRAEIKAEVKKRNLIKVNMDETNLKKLSKKHFKQLREIAKLNVNDKSNRGNIVGVNEESQGDIQVPLFETFIDIQRN